VELTQGQKKWVIGGVIGAAALFVGYGLLHREPGRPSLTSAHHARGRRRGDASEDDQSDNQRGEYGHKKHHHHRRHARD